MGNLKAIIEALKMLKALIKWVSAFILQKKQEGQEGKIQEGEQKLKDANKIEDEKERLKKKAEAVREIEKGISGQ